MQLPQSIRHLRSSCLHSDYSPFRFCRLLSALLLLIVFPAAASGEPLILVRDADSEYTGKIMALNRAQCTLMDRQGQLIELDVPKLTGMQRLSDRFRADSISAFRASLSAEFGKRYEVSGTTHYLVCAPRGDADNYARLFESIYREVEQFYRVRGFKVTRPEVPLVAVVFATQQEFTAYCVKDGVPPNPGLQGYYSLVSNRVALFDTAGSFRSADGTRQTDIRSAVALSGITGQTASTIVHETIHQVGYNIGIHTRLGEAPLWLVEGMATVLEPSAMRKRRSNQQSRQRVNTERFDWFRSRHLPNRASGSLPKMIASDSLFQRQTLNAYSEAWALTFFMMENPSRRKDLSAYLQKIASRRSTGAYSAKERLEDFQSVFGDIARLEVEFLRYMERL